MGGLVADTNSVPTLVNTITNITNQIRQGVIQTYQTTMAEYAKMKQLANELYQKATFARIFAFFAIVIGILTAIGKGIKSFGCFLKYIFVDHFIECIEQLGRVLMFFFINPFLPPTVCILWWVIYVVLFIIWHLLYVILKSFNAEFIMDTLFCTLRVIDEIDLTVGNLFLTKFPKMVLCNCFTIPDMDILISYYVGKCNFAGLKDMENSFGPNAQLNQCYGPCGDTEKNCRYPVECGIFETSN
jgi:hypothetical protein